MDNPLENPLIMPVGFLGRSRYVLLFYVNADKNRKKIEKNRKKIEKRLFFLEKNPILKR
jgi:hypothetical protein